MGSGRGLVSIVRGLWVVLIILLLPIPSGQAMPGGFPVADQALPPIVELRSDRLVVLVRTNPWHLEIRERVSGSRVLAEYPPESAGDPGRLVGSLGVLVAERGDGGSGSVRTRWRRATAILHSARRADGLHVVTATDDPSGRRLEIHLRFSDPSTLDVRVSPQPPDGVLEVAEGLLSEREERYFGLGARFGSLDARGSDVRSRVQGQPDTLAPTGTYLPVPFLVSSRRYGIKVNGMDESVVHLNTVRRDALIFKARGASLDFTIFTGRTPLEVVAAHARAMGPPALPPPWAFGVWKTVLGGDERVLDEVERLRRERLPVTVLWSYDMVDEMRNLGWTRWVYRPVAPGRYRDIAGLTRRLRALGYRVLGYVSPEVSADSRLFTFGAARRYFIESGTGEPYLKAGMQGQPVALLDFTNPDAVRWWQSLMTSVITDLGFDGWMQDGGDEAPEDGTYFSGVRGTAARNAYPLAYARVTREAALQARPDHVSFMRTGFAGSQRYTPVAWPCDNVFSWSQRDGLPAALRAALSGSVSGFPFWAPDIGGYFGCSAGGPLDEELWIRWVQLGALHPIMRDHLGDKCSGAIDLWSTPATLAAFRRYATLHQSLVPYLHRLALEAATAGRPVMRPVALVSPDDPRASRDEFTYLLGEDLLVAPVVEAGARRRQLYMPEGEWIDWWEGRPYRGPDLVTVAAPLDRIPLFRRAGAVLPGHAD